VSELVDNALALDKWSLGRLISQFEDTRASAAAMRSDILTELAGRQDSRRATFVGITGPPGVGKSSIIGELATRLIATDETTAVAVLAVDPTSHVSGGALLGDRTRVNFPADELRLFFRSQASERDLGGVGRATFAVCRLMRHLFDYVFIETVGIGQSEIEIQQVADWTYLMVQPLTGDAIQFMKAGVMEIPSAFILNKCDEKTVAQRSYAALSSSLRAFRADGTVPTIHRTSAHTGEGVAEVVAEIAAPDFAPNRPTLRDKELYFLEKWIRDEYGRAGLAFYKEQGADAFLSGDLPTAYEQAQTRFANTFGIQ